MYSLQRIKKTFQKNKDKIFIISDLTHQKITYGELYDVAKSLSCYLQEKGLVKGNKIVVLLNNCDDVIPIYFSLRTPQVAILAICGSRKILNMMHYMRIIMNH